MTDDTPHGDSIRLSAGGEREPVAEVWVGGEHYVLRDDEVDMLFECGQSAETPDQAWARLERVLAYVAEDRQ